MNHGGRASSLSVLVVVVVVVVVVLAVAVAVAVAVTVTVVVPLTNSPSFQRQCQLEFAAASRFSLARLLGFIGTNLSKSGALAFTFENRLLTKQVISKKKLRPEIFPR